MKRIKIIPLYEILATPLPLVSNDIMRIRSCSRATALEYIKKVQNHFAAKGERVNPKHITRRQLCEYEGWDWDEIKQTALTEMRISACGG